MCQPYIDTNNPQGMQLGSFKNRTPARFEYIYCTLFPLPNFSYKDPRMTEVTYHCINFNDRVRKVSKIYNWMIFPGGSNFGIHNNKNPP